MWKILPPPPPTGTVHLLPGVAFQFAVMMGELAKYHPEGPAVLKRQRDHGSDGILCLLGDFGRVIRVGGHAIAEWCEDAQFEKESVHRPGARCVTTVGQKRTAA